jgi:predicted TPR repeat methyltransferase
MNRKQTFVDLGCGNGLLTFLLVSEGYHGFGVDIADRKIWPALCKDKTDDMLRSKNFYSFMYMIFISFH